MSAAVDQLLERMAAAERRLVEHAAAPVPSGLTNPDPGAEERWEAGQVWAHIAEFPSYWMFEAQRVAKQRSSEPVAFGRVKTDARRVDAIERERHTAPDALLERVRTSLADVSDAVRGFTAEDWTALGIHPTRGEISVQGIIEDFIVDHLEEHADQLDALANRAS
jgi:hypothetical protein